MSLKNWHLFIAIICLKCAFLPAQTSYQKIVNDFAKDSELKYASLSIALVDTKTGELLAQFDAQRSLSPASNLKLLTTASALAILSPDFQYKTELQYDGQISKEGVLSGNLYLKGYGDPSLGSPELEQSVPFAEIMERFRMAAQQQGIRRVEGYVVGDGSVFETTGTIPSWQWEDMGNYYGAGAWGLNLHDNLYYLHFRQSSQLGDTPSIDRLEPEVPGLEFYNELRSAAKGSGDNAYIFGSPYQFTNFIRGTIPVGDGLFTIKGAVPDPPLWVAQHLEHEFNTIGVQVQKGAISQFQLVQTGMKIPQRHTIYTHYSPNLSAIVRRTNMESVNLYCEAMLKTIGWQKDTEGSTQAGLEHQEKFWKEKGLSFDGCNLVDGSGLSEGDKVTSLFLARLLEKMTKQEAAVFQAFYASIPEAGRSGALKNRFKGTAAEGRLRAKSGTLENVRAFSGYIETKDGRLFAFSVIVNNYLISGGAMRQKLEELLVKWCQ
ncbi:MAG TPA: D-alanyl-D-alanine carboxypeptidase/D-alanyl-D-alanine-endopeptidase [Saprospiraceae bacterium]|nr:D-alanyl-D-alanine carboxypeptidase/D-alanyl-D-alanine-endopeptidase [Saprospiraceae bacterium]HMQ83826.1 D-alanyl-D-alanine carboxypeptidase/D-alanyl-D-alanine-endopeptidase [Saprospiraceae bacterium]